MPELPDVELFKRYLDRRALRRQIRDVEVSAHGMLGEAGPRALVRALIGQTLRSSRRHGKYLFVRARKDRWLTLHFGMTGFLRYLTPPESPPRHSRLLIRFAGGSALAFSCQRKLGRIDLVEDVEAFIRRKGLGPDALDPRLDRAAFGRILSRGRGAVKALLMDQHRLAGIGNVYADAMLFRARIHPAARVRDLRGSGASALYRAMRGSLRQAIACAADPSRFPRTSLLPHRRRGGRCPRCGHPLERATIAGRATYFCPHDQPGRASPGRSRGG